VAAVVVMEAAEVAVGVIEHSIPSSDLQEWFTPFGTVQSRQVIPRGTVAGGSRRTYFSRIDLAFLVRSMLK
jgi:hypothetical protein